MQTLASIELVWALFIIITIVAQIVKGARKVASQAPGKEGDADGERNRPAPDDELRKFLEGLSGGTPPKPAATPPPVPPPVRPMAQPQARPRQTVRKPEPIRIKPQPKPKPPPPRVAAPPIVEQPVAVAPAALVASPQRKASRFQKLLQKDLADSEAAQKAIVLREVLGPPLALRPLEWRV